MLNIKKILLPVDFPNASLRVIHQAATLARHFHSEIVMLHAVTARSHAAGVPKDDAELARWDLLAEMVKRAPKNLDQSLGQELEGLGHPAHVGQRQPGPGNCGDGSGRKKPT